MNIRLLTSYRRLRAFRCFTTSTPFSSSKHKILDDPPDSRFPWLEKIKYNTFLEKTVIRPNYKERVQAISAYPKTEASMVKENYEKNRTIVALKYYDSSFVNNPVYREYVDPMEQRIIDEMEKEISGDHQFPYQIYTDYSKVEPADEDGLLGSENVTSSSSSDECNRTEKNFEDKPNPIDDDSSWVHDYGIPNPQIPSSQVPCGGCGAHLHCQDTAIPGYIPSERFKGLSTNDLRTQICQRCYFLKVHDTALNVQVRREEYPEILSHIKNKRALVLLLVDLTDFPCSIWPGIVEIIGEKRPVILVGNKVDLIPRDSKNYLEHVKKCLRLSAEDMGLDRCRIVDTQLISAFTGYGVENLISQIFDMWGVKGDIYIMGCTNVGKSTLFNVFLQSDLCKVQVVDLVQRATVSAWPGTTLNLLKFPVLVPEGWKIHVRSARMQKWYELEEEEKKMREYQISQTKNPMFATLMGRVDRSFEKPATKEELKLMRYSRDEFVVDPRNTALPRLREVGKWNPDDPFFANDTWCYDTPGTVNENQILDILSLPELMKVVCKKIIQPRSYVIKLGMSLFVGGIIRIDFVEGALPIRYTVFTSTALPVTIVPTEDADEVYEKALGTPILGVPMGGKDRLSKFPKLKSRDFEIEGTGLQYSCSDVVISGAGWVAVTAQNAQYCRLTVHTPNGAGMFCRSPSLLPYMFNLRGPRIYKTYAYGKHLAYVPSAGRKF